MTLTQAASITRKGVILTIAMGILGTSGLVGLDMYQKYQIAHTPPVIEKPEMKFGALPQIIFPPATVSSSNFSYTLDTTTGGLPQTPKMTKVYFIPKAGVSFLAPQKAQKLAQSFGFDGTSVSTSSAQYKFSDGAGGELSIDTDTGNFHFQKSAQIKTKTSQLPEIPVQPLPNQTNLLAIFKSFLSLNNLFPNDLSDTRNTVIYDNNSPSDAMTAQISLWPNDIDKLPVVTNTFKDGLIKATYTRTSDAPKIIALDYVFWPIDQTTSSTYPLKTAEEAFSELQSGQGFIAVEPSKPQVSISSIYLAYFEPDTYSPYLQPIFIFEGPDFVAEVPAIAQITK